MLIALWLCTSCNDSKQTLETDVTVVVDKTDKMTVYPTADEITSPLGLKNNPWQGLRFTATYISDKDINDVTVLTLDAENQWDGNILIRKAKVRHFVKQVQECLAGMKYTGTCPYSIIYRTIARQANGLTGSTAKRKLLLIYSDLCENDADLNFYDRKVMNRVKNNPQSIAVQLEATVPLNPLNGVQVWLLYSPGSFKQNNDYMPVANLYKQMLKAKGATVHIGNTLNL